MHGYGEYFLEENDEWNNFLFPFWKNVENYKDSFSNPSTLILRRNSPYPEYKYFKNLDPILTIERYHSISRSSRCIRWKNFTKFPNSNFDKFLHPSSPLIRRRKNIRDSSVKSANCANPWRDMAGSQSETWYSTGNACFMGDGEGAGWNRCAYRALSYQGTLSSFEKDVDRERN